MNILKKGFICLSILLIGYATLYADTSFDIAVSFGKADYYSFGITSIVSQQVTDKLAIDSSVQYLTNNEYEATLKTTWSFYSWFDAGAGFLLFTDESAMLPALTASADFTIGKLAKTGISGSLGLNENDLKKPYLYRVASVSRFYTKESVIDLTVSWQLLMPDTFKRTDIQADAKAYAISPDNNKFKVFFDFNGGVRIDSRVDEVFSLTGGVGMGIDYGTDLQGFYGSVSVLPVDTRGDRNIFSGTAWLATGGFRFKY